MKTSIIIILLLSTLQVLAQKTSHDSNKDYLINFSIPDTLSLNNIKSDQLKESDLQKNMPWITALIIGFLSAIANFIIANRLKTSNERNLQRQIENSKEINLTQFKATIGTKNRQEWINEIRHILSDMLANSALASVQLQEKEPSRDFIYKYSERILYCRSKIQMLLNDEKPEQKKVLDAVNTFMEAYLVSNKEEPNTIKINSAKQLVLESARELFKLHWKKIKNLE